MTSPFKFLDSYDKSDAKRFFGRDRETAQLYNAVFASNLTLLYGGSGTGKTSLINCGLANKFYDTDWQPIFIRRGNDFNQSLDNALRKAVRNPTAEFDVEPIEDKIESVYRDSYRPVFLIFDQFEELFVLGKKEEAQAFYKTIRRILDSKYSKIKAKIIVSIREEWMAYLHEFEREVPYLFDNRVRVERMDDRNLFSVVGGTLTAANIGIEDPSVTIRLILENIRDKKLGVDLTNLQVYLDRVYRKAVEISNAKDSKDSKFQIPNSKDFKDSEIIASVSGISNLESLESLESRIIFTPSVVNEVGAIDNVISDFLDEQFTGIEGGLTERGIKQAKGLTLEILFTMISNDGTKRQVKVDGILENLPKNIVVTADDIGFCLVEFKRIRILRDVDEQFELSHDSIAKQIGEKASGDAKNRRKVEVLLQQAMDLYAKRKTLLSPDQLDEIRPFEGILRLNDAETVFIRKSKRAIRIRKSAQVILVGSVMAILVLAALFALRMAKIAQAEGKKANAQRLATLAKKAFDERNFSDALTLSNESLTLQPNDNEALRVLSEAYHANYSTYAPLSIGSLQTDFRTAVQTVFSPKSDYILVLPAYNATAAAQDTDAVYSFSRNAKTGRFGHKTLLRKKVDAAFKPVFNDEGNQILVYNTDSTLVLLDTTGKTLNILRGHSDLVRQAFYSKNNQCWVTCGLDGLVILWDKEGNFLHLMRKSKAAIVQMRLNRTETEIATWSDSETIDSVEVQSFPLGKAKYRFKQPEGIVEDLVFDAANKQVISFAHGKLWYWKNGEKQSEAFFAGGYDRKKYARFNPKGTAFFSHDQDENLRVQRRLNNYKGYGEKSEPKHFSLTGFSVKDAAWSADGDKIAVMTGGETIEIQDTLGKVLSRLTHEGAQDAVFSDDGKKMITTDDRGLLRFWDTEAAEILVLDFERNITHLEFSPTSNSLLVCAQDTLARLVDSKGNLLKELPQTKGTTKAQFSKNGKRFMLLSANKVSIFDDYGQLITDSIRLTETINDALFTADGNTIFTTTVDSNSVFWHLNSAILRGYSFKEKIATSDFSPDNRRFVSVEWRDSVRFTLREADGSMSRVIGKYPEWTQVNEVKFMPDNRRILTFTEGNELYFVAEGEKPQLLLNGAKPKRIWVADDRQHMAIELKSALELRTTEGKMIQTMRQTRGVNGDVSKIAFSPDGMRLAVVYNTGKVVFWWTPRAVLARVQARHRA